MTFIDNLTDGTLEILKEIYGGAVSSAARDSEALAYGNGISSPTGNDPLMRNAIAHAHSSAAATRKYGSELAKVFGEAKEVVPSVKEDPADDWKDRYNNQVGQKIADWMETEGYTDTNINPDTGQYYTEDELAEIMDNLIMDAANSGELVVDPSTDPRMGGSGNTDSHNVPLDSNGNPKDPEDEVSWNGPDTSIDPATGEEDWKDASAGRDYTNPNVAPPEVWDDPVAAAGYYGSRGLEAIISGAKAAYDAGEDVVARVYVELAEHAEKVKDLLDGYAEAASQAAIDFAQGVADFNQDLRDFLTAIGVSAADATAEAAKTIADAGATLFDGAMNGLNDLGQWFVNFWEATGDAAWMGSPLVLDLDGDGIELVSLENSNVLWDIDEDGFAEHTGWVAADDGMLAIDLDGDGLVTDHTELFGSVSEDGFTALSVYDTNADGIIDANDTQFSDLLVWQDVNQNGISEAVELYTLNELNIISINLNASTPFELYIEGHNISHVSSYTVDDGINAPQTLEIVDAWFQFDNRNTEFVDDYTLDLASLYVTTVRGYGSLPDLYVSASIDNDTSDPDSLLSLLQDFDQLELTDLFADDRSIMDQTRAIMLRWAGADTVDPASMGQWADAQELTFINALRGSQWLWLGNDPNPWSASSQGLQKAFEIALYAITSKLVAQAAGAALFNEETYYSSATDSFEGFTAFNQDALDDLLAKSLDGTQVASKTEYWVQVVNMVDNSVGVSNLTTTQFDILEATIQASDSTLTIVDLQDKIAKNIEDQLSWTPDGDYILGTSGDDVYNGTVGEDFYDGGAGNDTLNGGIGNDLLYGSGGDDVLDGGLGNDELRGHNGNDTYLFYLGQGDDVIIEQNGDDKILFGAGITATDLSFIRVGTYDLTIQIDPTVGYGSITIQGHFSGGVLETLEFNDGSTLDLNSLDYTYIGSSANETIYGVRTDLGGSGVDTLYGNGGDDVIRGTGVAGSSTTAKNTIYGGDGNDTLYADNAGDYLDGGADNDVINGLSGVDTLIGGTGDDTLKGAHGDDIYIFNYGDGNDIIYDTKNNDTILMGAGIDASMITATRLNINDLVLEIDGGAGGTITLQYHTYGVGNVIETMEFADGSTLDLSSFDLTLNGTSANEYLYGVNVGGSGVDTIYGNDGNDTIYGYRSTADTNENFLYGGNGNDIVYGAHGDDIIEGGDGADTVQAYNGNDQITGGTGDDTLRGYNGDDVYIFNYGDGNDFIEEKSGTDKILFGAGITVAMIDVTRLNINDVMIEIDGGAGGSIELNWHTYGAGYVVETLEFDDGSTIDLTALDLTMNGTSGNDVLYGVTYGGSGVDTIYGNAGNDIIYGYRSGVDTNENTIFGGDGNDIIYGANGNDIIEGGDGNDSIWGLSGDDVITGGAGVDSIYGSAGADTFVFEASSAFLDVDTIQDFKTSQNDVLDISDLLIGYDPLTDLITDFVQITDSGSTSIVSVDADGGADNFVQIVTLNWINGLTDEEALETSGNLIAA